MRLFLARHGQSSPGDIDPQKGLTKNGEKEIIKLAESIKHLDISVDEIWHSGKTRAAQTADILAMAVKPKKGVRIQEGLKPDDSVESIAGEITAYGTDLMLVGHLPFMLKLASLLLANDSNRCSVNFYAGSLACFEYDKGNWSLSWLINPGLVKEEESRTFQSYH
ncbi:MAG: phosphohistidine phosphatase SixA [candidate division Zixibacteria bacterium]|nr:phosphohistidine phosphatase SixA [candidate division Zixibacteria bacterium]